MVKVYFQSFVGSHSELVAVFKDEETYIQCLPALEHIAKTMRMFVTEEMIEQEDEILDKLFY